MLKTSTLTLGGIIGELAIDIVFFPFWWYSLGLLKTAGRLTDFLAEREKSLALFVWMKNLFVPMYGQYDWQGRLISFFIRLAQIIFRSVILLFWVAVAAAAFLFWLAFPALVVYEIYWQLF